MKIILTKPPAYAFHADKDGVRPMPPMTESHDLAYDPTAAERCHEALVVLRQENIPVAGLALGVRAFWSVEAMMQARPLNCSPDSMHFVPNDDRALAKLQDCPLLLDPYAHEDSVRPLCGTEGTRLALGGR